MGLFHKLDFFDALQILDCDSLSAQQKKKIIKAESHFTEDEKSACYMLFCLHQGDCGRALYFINRTQHEEKLPGVMMAALYTHIAFRKFSEAHEENPSCPDYIAYLALAYEHGFFGCEKNHSKAVETAEPLRSSEATGALVKQALKDIFPEGADSAASDNKSADTPESEKANAAAIADTESTSPVVPSAAKDSSDKSAPQGEFKRIEIDGDLFEGYFLNGKKNGRGKYIWANGNVYDGNWVDGKCTGKGRISWSSGASFDGEWKDNQMSEGKYIYADGSVYEGSFKNGKRDGYGKRIYTSGDKYEGRWQSGSRNGKGVYTWADGDVYDGEWKDDKRCGVGRMVMYGKAGPDALNAGEVFIKYSYDGEWLDNREHGHGICREGNGTVAGMDKVYEGEWVNGKKCGRFVWHFLHRDGETGKSYIDFYEDGNLIETCIPYDERIKTVDDAKKFREAEKRARISAVKTDFRLAKQLDMNIAASVGYYDGDYMNGERNGYGECAYDNGDKYIGTWKDGAANGVGRYDFARGGFYFGQFLNGRVDGYGVYFDGNDYHIGMFENGECVTERDLVFEIGSEGKWLPLAFESDESIQIYGDLKKPSDSIMKYSEGVEYSSSARMWVASFNENLMVMGKVLQKGGPINDQNGVFIYTNHADGLVATGEIRNSMLNGRVTIRYITGETVEADCVDNKPIETYHSWDKFGREVW